MKESNFSANGFSLVEILLALAVIGIGGYAIQQLLVGSLVAANNLEQKVGWTNLQSEILNILMHPESCKATFSGIAFNYPTTAQVKTKTGVTTNTRLQVGDVHERVKIEKLEAMIPTPSDDGRSLGLLTIEGLKQGKHFGDPSKKLDFKVQLKYQGSTLTNCTYLGTDYAFEGLKLMDIYQGTIDWRPGGSSTQLVLDGDKLTWDCMGGECSKEQRFDVPQNTPEVAKMTFTAKGAFALMQLRSNIKVKGASLSGGVEYQAWDVTNNRDAYSTCRPQGCWRTVTWIYGNTDGETSGGYNASMEQSIPTIPGNEFELRFRLRAVSDEVTFSSTAAFKFNGVMPILLKDYQRL